MSPVIASCIKSLASVYVLQVQTWVSEVKALIAVIQLVLF